MKTISRFKLFIIGVIFIKLLLMGLFSSDYQNILFMKFIDGFIEQVKNRNFINPYRLFYKEINLFPYPPIMFFIELISGFFTIFFENNILKNILFKLPSLLFDLLGLYFLTKMFPNKRKHIGILFFASPMILYSTYMHGQLDIIPTILLLGSIYFLVIKQNHFLFAFFLYLSLGSKLHVLAVLPILFLYILKKDGWIIAVKDIGLSLLLLILTILPFLDDRNGFLNMVLLNNEQLSMTSIFIEYKNVKIYVSIFVIALIYLKAFSIKKMNKSLLFSFCGILFSVFLILMLPMPGWYVWIVPFIAIFFINIDLNKYTNMIIYLSLNICYLLYFICIHKTNYVNLYFLKVNMDFIKINNMVISNTIFTILTALLAYITYMMYQLGVSNNSFYKSGSKPFTIGISGDSGSGKSTLLEMIKIIFGEKKLLFLEGDGDHRWERGDEMWQHYTHLNPKANYIYKQANDLARLKENQNIYRSEYEHDTGKFSDECKIKPKPYIVLCGLHAFYLPQVRKNLDLKIYMDIDETLRRYWKIDRDTKKRGYTKEEILKQIEGRVKDAVKYIYPQKVYSDFIIKYYDKTLKDCLMENHDIKLDLELTLNSEVDLEFLIDNLIENDILVEHDYSMDLKKQIINLSGESLNKKTINFKKIIEQIIPNLDEIYQNNLEYKDNRQGIIESVLLLLISYKMREEEKN